MHRALSRILRGTDGVVVCLGGRQEVWLDQEDALLLTEGEEVTLMDWGNAVIQVWARQPWQVTTAPVPPGMLPCPDTPTKMHRMLFVTGLA